ncbi:MAG: hypothetical protein ACTHOJ_10750 [Sphingomonas oligoaromativorans]
MIFIREGFISPDQIDGVLRRVGELLRSMDAESVSSFQLTCFPWRNDKRLQAVSGRSVVPVYIDLPEDGSEDGYSAPVIRERPDDLGDFGIGLWMDHDD